MSYKYESVVNVIGHINPDTDSVCSAIAYANLKSQSTGEKCRNAVCVEAFWCVGTRLYGRCPDTGY